MVQHLTKASLTVSTTVVDSAFEMESTATKKRKLKSVSFNPTTETYQIVEPEVELSQQEHHLHQQTQKEDYWYNTEDLMYIKYCSIKKALAVRADHSANLRHRSSYSNTLLAAYLYCCGRSLAMATNNNNPAEANDVENSSATHQDHFSQSTATLRGLAARLARATTNPTWRGLEFHSVYTVRMERARQRQSVRHAVLSIQRDACTSDGAALTNMTLPERLREASEQGSMAAVLFAQVLGHADELAAQQNYQQNSHQKRDSRATVSELRPKKRARSSKSTAILAAAATGLTTDEGKTAAACKMQLIPSFDEMAPENVELPSSSPRGVVPVIAVKAL